MTSEVLEPGAVIQPGLTDLGYLHAAKLVFDTPLLLAETQGLLIGEYLAARMEGSEPPAPQGNRFVGEEQFDLSADGRRWRGYARTDDVARVSLMGELVNRGAWMGSYSGMTSYEGFTHTLKLVEDDPEIRTAVLDVNTPGGQASGMLEAGRAVRSLAEKKPVIAVVNSLAASAGYGLISGATEIVAAESAELGSIGVLMLHFDRSQQLAERGVKATIIHAGARKVDGNPFGPLEGAAKEAIEARIARIMNQFVGLVSEHRGISAQSVIDLQAGILSAEQAVAAGLADRIGTFQSVLADITRARGGRLHSQKKDIDMSETNGGPAAENNTGITQGQLDQAVAQATSDGQAAGAEAERTRISTVLSAERIASDAVLRVAAVDLAIKSPSMSAEDIVAFVAANVTASSDDPEEDASLKNRQTDADPIGSSAGNSDKQETSGLSRMVGAQVERMTH